MGNLRHCGTTRPVRQFQDWSDTRDDGGTKIYAAIRARSLSDRERELLVHASRDGDFYVLRTDMHGSWVRAGTTDFFDQSDRAHQACYLDGFRSLCQRGFVHHEGGHYANS